MKNTIGKANTAVYIENGETVIRYHETDVLRVSEEKIVLNTGGYFTKTTKARMNEGARAFSLPLEVLQKKNLWYAVYNGKTFLFSEKSLTISRKAGK